MSSSTAEETTTSGETVKGLTLSDSCVKVSTLRNLDLGNHNQPDVHAKHWEREKESETLRERERRCLPKYCDSLARH